MSEWLAISREGVEENLGRNLTNEEWAKIAEEIHGRVENFIEEIIDAIVEEVTA